jgi:hypothetical protein
MIPTLRGDAGAAVLQRKSGLVLPTSGDPLQKRARTMARKKFLKLLRYMHTVRDDHGLVMRFTCATCKQPVKLERGESAIVQTDAAETTVDPRKDAFSLQCRCSVWTVKK